MSISIYAQEQMVTELDKAYREGQYDSIEKRDSTKDFECLITTRKQVYKIGETPKITVSIKNNTGKDVYLIGSLDGSEVRWRIPYCYFKINKPTIDTLPVLRRCGIVNPLRKEDFVLVKAGETFDPYQSVDDYGFFSSNEINRKENFRKPGKYSITFCYSTMPTGGYGFAANVNKTPELKTLLSNLPKIELTSNTLEIQIRK